MGPRITLLPESVKKIAIPVTHTDSWALRGESTTRVIRRAKAAMPPERSIRRTNPPMTRMISTISALAASVSWAMIPRWKTSSTPSQR